MPNFTPEEMRAVMNNPDHIRNISIIAHVDHGKSTLTDSLICRAGIISAKAAGDARFTDTRADEQERGVTIKSTGVSLYFNCAPKDGEKEIGHLINLIDSPGHVDFSSEVTAALRVTDGAIVVVDCIEGCAVQTETVLRQSIAERVKPVLFLNKVDRCILELMMEPEDMYLRFQKTIEDVNVIISMYTDPNMPDGSLFPGQGTVAFGSGLHGWAFNIERFAKIYALKFGMEKDKMMQKLWGDAFFSGKEKKWSNLQGKEGYKRGFCQFIMEPIATVMRAIMDGKKEKYDKMLETLAVPLTKDDRLLDGKPFMKRVMQKWINAADTLLTMIVTHLPSPRVAQKYRVDTLYSGPLDDEAAQAIRNCDPNGPLMMYVSKMIPTTDKGRFTAFGRIFSGIAKTGQKVRIQGPYYVPGSKDDLSIKNIQRTVLMMGARIEQMQDVPCGNTCGLVGIDQYIIKTGTITDLDSAHNFVDMKYSVSPVVRVAVRVKDGKDLPKLVDGLKKLAKSDPLVVCTIEESGEHVVAGCGELHVEICLKDLQEEYAQCPLIIADPVVSYRETVASTSTQTCLSKSPNKHNRLYMTAQPLDEDLANKIDAGKLGSKLDIKERSKIWADEYGWDRNDALKVWCFGPDTAGPNVVCDQTTGVQYLNEIKEHINSAFQWCTKDGPLAEENMRGIRFNIHDVTLHADAIHRGAGQLMPVTRRVCYASSMCAEPTLQEPIFLVEIVCPQEAMSGVYSCLNMRRGMVFEENAREGTPLIQCKAYLPVAESFGFTAALRQSTSGQAFPQSVFDHWENLPGDAMKEGKVQDICLGIRKRKHMKNEMPSFGDYNDKL